MNIPTIKEIHLLMIYLGIVSRKPKFENKSLTMENIGMCLSYFMDANIEINYLKNIHMLHDRRKTIANNISLNCPILIGKF